MCKNKILAIILSTFFLLPSYINASESIYKTKVDKLLSSYELGLNKKNYTNESKILKFEKILLRVTQLKEKLIKVSKYKGNNKDLIDTLENSIKLKITEFKKNNEEEDIKIEEIFKDDNDIKIGDTKGCSVDNGSGQQTWNGSAWGSCKVNYCVSNYISNSDNTKCVAKKLSCSTGTHEENGSCIENTKGCSVDNGSGQQTWNGSAWGSCKVNYCVSSYKIDSVNNLCKKNILSIEELKKEVNKYSEVSGLSNPGLNYLIQENGKTYEIKISYSKTIYGTINIESIDLKNQILLKDQNGNYLLSINGFIKSEYIIQNTTKIDINKAKYTVKKLYFNADIIDSTSISMLTVNDNGNSKYIYYKSNPGVPSVIYMTTDGTLDINTGLNGPYGESELKAFYNGINLSEQIMFEKTSSNGILLYGITTAGLINY